MKIAGEPTDTRIHQYHQTPSNNFRLNFLRHWQLYAIMLIPFAYLIIFRYIPMGGIIIAFKKYRVTKGIFGSDWDAYVDQLNGIGLNEWIELYQTAYDRQYN
jgi:ABC-type polysaccharide transport system permease subunit